MNQDLMLCVVFVLGALVQYFVLLYRQRRAYLMTTAFRAKALLVIHDSLDETIRRLNSAYDQGSISAELYKRYAAGLVSCRSKRAHVPSISCWPWQWRCLP